MSNSDSIWSKHKPVSGGGDYLRLKNGERKKVRFVSEPAVVTYDGFKARYQVVLYNKTDKIAQIYEFGPQVYGQIGELVEEWGDPTVFDMTIGRQGSTQFDTSYTVNPSPKSIDLTPEEAAKANEVKFPGSRAKWLKDYEEDGLLPEPIQTTKQPQSGSDDDVLNQVFPGNEVL